MSHASLGGLRTALEELRKGRVLRGLVHLLHLQLALNLHKLALDVGPEQERKFAHGEASVAHAAFLAGPQRELVDEMLRGVFRRD